MHAGRGFVELEFLSVLHRIWHLRMWLCSHPKGIQTPQGEGCFLWWSTPVVCHLKSWQTSWGTRGWKRMEKVEQVCSREWTLWVTVTRNPFSTWSALRQIKTWTRTCLWPIKKLGRAHLTWHSVLHRGVLYSGRVLWILLCCSTADKESFRVTAAYLQCLISPLENVRQ